MELGSNTQLILDLPVRAALDRYDFLVADSNFAAVEWIDKWPDWPNHVLLLAGPEKSGKSHLSRVWQEKSGAFSPVGNDIDACMSQAADGLPICLDINGELDDEEALFHLVNWVKEHDTSLLITALDPPNGWHIKLPDLRSRLLAAHLVTLGVPDDNLLAAVMVKHFADRQISITEDVLRYLMPRIERSFASVSDIVERLDDASLSEGRAVTIPLAKRVLVI
jgi:chromosomal replication initiation ATPase DnaA